MSFVVTNLGVQAAFVGNNTITTGVNVPAGSAFIVVTNEGGAAAGTGALSQNGNSDTFTNYNNAQPNSANGRVIIWAIDKTSSLIASGTVITFVPSGTGNGQSAMGAFFITGTNTLPPVTNATPTVGAGTNNLSIGPVSVPSGSIALGLFGANGGSISAWTPDATWTTVNQLNTQVAAGGVQCSYSIATPVTDAPTLSVSRSWAGFMLAYNPPFIVNTSLDGLSSSGRFGSGPLGF